MIHGLAVILGLAVLVWTAPPAAAMVCPPPGPFAPTVAQAADIGATGFNCKQVDLTLTVSITPISLQQLKLVAKTIAIVGPVSIVNAVPGSSIVVTAEGGGIAIDKATIKAANQITIECKPAACPVTVTDSVIQAPINPLDTTGDVRVIANGDVRITGSTFSGGSKVGVFSAAGGVTWVCAGTTGACEDPLRSGKAIAACGADPVDPTKPKLPCTPTFATLADVGNFCLGTVGSLLCGGGDSECQVNAYLDVHLEASTIACQAHFGITSKAGSIFADGADLTAQDALTLQAYKGVFAKIADLTSLNGAVTVEVKGGIPAGTTCIDLKGAVLSVPSVIQAKNGCGVIPP